MVFTDKVVDKKNTQYYSVYGLTVESEFELPELPEIKYTPEATDVVVHSEDLSSLPEDVDNQQSGNTACRVTYDSIGTVLVEEGEHIACDLVSEATSERKDFRRFLEHQVMAVLLMQRDLLLLHASAVSVEGKCAIFLGPQTAGKSTTAAAFHAEGYSIMADDIVAIRFEDGVPIVVPGVSQPRLENDAVDALEFSDTVFYPDDHGPKKHYLQTDTYPTEAPLKGCYKLHDSGSISLEELSGARQYFEFVENVHPLGFLSDTTMTQQDFEQCSKVVETTQVRLLHRPRDHEKLPQIVEVVADDLREGNPK